MNLGKRADMKILKVNLLMLGVLCFVQKTNAHARLLNPPGRSSMWRYGYDVPVNYDDNGLFCGGYRNTVLHDGQCGVCGDPYQGPYYNEAGGTYAKGIIVRHYPSGGVYMKTTVDVTAYHKGYFEFRLCPHDNPKIRVQQTCLDKYLLIISEGIKQGNPTRFYPQSPGIYHLQVKLPDDIICHQCVLQWKYTTGNFWGTDSDGKSCMGCGYQELFVNCADIAIGVVKTTEEKHERIDTTDIVNALNHSTASLPNTLNSHKTDKNTANVIKTGNNNTKTENKVVSAATLRNRSEECNRCHALPTWKHFPRMDEWCDTNCKNGNCPPCRCYCGCPDLVFKNPCKGKGDYSPDYKMDNWCWRECCESECPNDKCACSSDLKNPVHSSFTKAESNVKTQFFNVPDPNKHMGSSISDPNKHVSPSIPDPNNYVSSNFLEGNINTIIPEDILSDKIIGDDAPKTEISKLNEEKKRVLEAFLGGHIPSTGHNEKSDKSNITRKGHINKSVVSKSPTVGGVTHIWGEKVHRDLSSESSRETQTLGIKIYPQWNEPSTDSEVTSHKINPNIIQAAGKTDRKQTNVFKTLGDIKGRIGHVDPYVLDLRLLRHLLKTIKSWFTKENIYMVL